MTQYTFKPKDFKAFEVEGLDARMEALNEYVRPQLHQLGDYFSEYFTSQTGETFYAHVAKHARRSVNPPVDTWVAFAPNKRGYKMLPHFQIGLFKDHLFLMFGVMHEGKDKVERVKVFDKHFDTLKHLPEDYQVSLDHMKPEKSYIKDLSDDELHQAIDRVKHVKRENFCCTYTLSNDAELKSDKAFLAFVKETFDEFLKFYE